MQKNIGDACDDGNPNTTGDKIQSDCTCKGTIISSGLNLTCPASQTINLVMGQTTAFATWASPIATTTCIGNAIKLTQTAGLTSGSPFPIGVQTISYSAVDSCAGAKSCSFTVTVNPPNTGGPDIALRFQNTQTSFTKFSNFHYIIEAKNAGNSVMTNVVIQFKFPAGTVNGGTAVPSLGTWQTYCAGGVQCFQWTIPSLALNSLATLDVVVFVLAPTSPIVATTQLLSAIPTDTNSANDIATFTMAPPLNLKATNTEQAIPIVIEKLYPNPVAEELDINLNSLVEKEIDFRFFNSLGTIISTEKRNVEKGENIFRFDVSTWSNGVYYVLPDTKEGINVPIKFIKME